MDTQSITELVHKIKDLIVEEVHPESIYLYGSQATGSADTYSDIDILVVQKGAIAPIDMDLDRKANALTNILVDIKFVDPQAINDYPSYKSALSSGKRLF